MMKEVKKQVAGILLALVISGCSHVNQGSEILMRDADSAFSHGNYAASLAKYGKLLEAKSAAKDRVLFEMGVIHAYPQNEEKDYQKALDCFQKLIREYPESGYRHDSEMMVLYLTGAVVKDKTVAAQKAEIDRLQQEVEGKNDEIVMLQKKNAELEQKLFGYVLRYRTADRIVVEKKERLLSLMSQGEVLKTYRVALGGNPSGPKESHNDNKTPEGTYTIDGRNRQSHYHLSLHISYPNAKDKKRAKELGVAPGGDIMIHGLKNGWSWVGDSHRESDWTQGCIAVTDEEIEEIAKLVPNGTAVEIRP
jgi:tetratricopeptide (TPR) repeat protein